MFFPGAITACWISRSERFRPSIARLIGILSFLRSKQNYRVSSVVGTAVWAQRLRPPKLRCCRWLMRLSVEETSIFGIQRLRRLSLGGDVFSIHQRQGTHIADDVRVMKRAPLFVGFFRSRRVWINMGCYGLLHVNRLKSGI